MTLRNAKAVKACIDRLDWIAARLEIAKASKSSLCNAELLLACAVHRAPVDLIDLLVSKGVDCNEKNQFNDTPLTLAIWHNNSREFIAKLIEYGADVNNRNTNGNCPITLSAEARVPVEVVELLLRAGCDVNATNMFGDNCCTLGVWNKAPLALMELYVKCGVDVNHGNVNGNSPLVLAGEINLDPNVIALLLRAGAQVNKSNNFGDTGLTLCAWKNSSIALARKYIEAGADVNQRNVNGNSVLSLACEANASLELITLLLENGADVNSVNNWGDGALNLACWKKSSLALILELLKHGADPRQTNQAGKTALALAREPHADAGLLTLLERATTGNGEALDFNQYDVQAISQLLARTKIYHADQVRYRDLLLARSFALGGGTVSLARLDRNALRAMGINLGDANQILKALGETPSPPSSATAEPRTAWPKLTLVLSLKEKHHFYAACTGQDYKLRVGKICKAFADRYSSANPPPPSSITASVAGMFEPSAVDECKLFVIFVSRAYLEEISRETEGGRELAEEFHYAGATRPKRIVVALLEKQVVDQTQWPDWIRNRLRNKPVIDLTAQDSSSAAAAAEALGRLFL